MGFPVVFSPLIIGAHILSLGEHMQFLIDYRNRVTCITGILWQTGGDFESSIKSGIIGIIIMRITIL